MNMFPPGAIAVIFVSRRTGAGEAGYQAAAAAMEAEAARQPGYLGIHSVRAADGEGITISYWTDEEAAARWRAHAGHSKVREQGRADWYDHYHLIVAGIIRDHRWERGAQGA